MVMSLVPMTALAAPENDGARTPSTQAATELPGAVDGVITLKEDVTLSTAYEVTKGNVIIDLAGYTLAYDGTGNVFLDVQGGSLTIRDSGGNGEVKVDEPYDGTGTGGKTQWIKCVQVHAGATFTLEGGTLTNTNTAFEATQVISNYGTTYIEGGTVKGVTGIFIYNPVRGNDEWTGYVSTCNVFGGRIEGVAPTTYQGNNKYGEETVADLNWSYGIAIYGPGVDSSGAVDNTKSVLNITDGTITAGQAIGTNASSGRYAGYTINMSGGTVDGGTGTGMYLPAIGKTNISGGKVTAAQAIRICAGELNVTGGTITCTAVSDNSDLIAGGSGGTLGAIVVGKASNGYVGDIVVNVSGSAVVQNTADKTGSNDVYPTIVVSDKNMALASDQYIKDPATGNDTKETFKYSETSTSVTVNATIKGDIVKISNLTQSSTTQDGGKTSLDITGGTVTGDVINQTTEGDLDISGSTITANTTFTAVWNYIPPANPNYKITIGDMENGTVTANPTAAKAGATVTLTPVPDEGYALSTLTVTDRFGDAVRVTEQADGTYTFPMPNGQVTVTATFVQVEEPAPTEPFVDVNEGDWFYDAVVYAYQNELMDGVGGNRFAPNSETTRAQLVTILYRLEGQPAVSGDLPFTDVEAGTWYTDAILWAAQNNIVNGVSDTEFAPGDDLTRQQLVTILYRYAESKGYDVSASADLSGYPDAGQVQDYAQPAMAWAVAENIIQGMEDGTLKPAGNASRAQIATILMRFCEDVAQ